MNGQSYGPWEESNSKVYPTEHTEERDQKRLPEIREKCKHNLQQPVFQHRRKHSSTVRECDTLEAGGWVYPDLICICAVEPENEQKVKGNE